MDKFTASNGTLIARKGRRALTVERPGTDRLLNINGDRADALCEFFRAERDEELGRWRWPDDPNVVVVPSDGTYHDDGKRWASVYDERMMGRSSWYCSEASAIGCRGDQPLHDAAHDYFEAHPERNPWEDAKHEDVWLLTVNGDTGPFLADQDSDSPVAAFVAANGTRIARYDREQITAGRRIYPEVSDAD